MSLKNRLPQFLPGVQTWTDIIGKIEPQTLSVMAAFSLENPCVSLFWGLNGKSVKFKSEIQAQTPTTTPRPASPAVVLALFTQLQKPKRKVSKTQNSIPKHKTSSPAVAAATDSQIYQAILTMHAYVFYCTVQYCTCCSCTLLIFQ